jgi:hypothetical protein
VCFTSKASSPAILLNNFPVPFICKICYVSNVNFSVVQLLYSWDEFREEI